MTTTPSEALTSLGVTDWTATGDEPTNETEFNNWFRKIVGVDSEGSAITSDDPADFGVTWAEVSAEMTRLDDIRSATAYRRKREEDYVKELSPEGRPLTSTGDPLDELYTQMNALLAHLSVTPTDGFKEMSDRIAAIKAKHPKPTSTRELPAPMRPPG